MAYNNIDNKFEYTIRNHSDLAIVTGYNGETSGDLIIPYYIKDGSDLYRVIRIDSNAFASTPTRQLTFNRIFISIEGNILTEAFIRTQAIFVYIANAQNIGKYAFSQMLYVDTFVMPANAPEDVAYGTRINNLYYLGTIDQWNSSTFRYSASYENVYFYYTSGPTIVGYKYWKYENGTIVTFNG